MKKQLLSLLAVATILLTSCGGSNGFLEQVLGQIEQATIKVENATTTEEVSAAAIELQEAMAEVAVKAGDAKFTPEQNAEMQAAIAEFATLSGDKINELSQIEIEEEK